MAKTTKPKAEQKPKESKTLVQGHALPLRGSFVGLDLSLTSAGLAILEPGRLTTRTICVETTGLTRLLQIAGEIMQAVVTAKPEAVVFEGYSFSSKFSHAHSLGELGGVVKLELAKLGIPMLIVPPNSLKKAMTGKGNCAGKGPVMLAVYKRYGLEVPQDDMCDGTALALIGAHWMSALDTPLPESHRAAFKDIEPVASPFPKARTRERGVPTNETNPLQPVAA